MAARNERFAYTTNTLSGTITTYRIDSSGALSVLGHTTSTPLGTPTGLPIDVGVSRDGHNLYALNGNQGTVSVFNINEDGALQGCRLQDGPIRHILVRKVWLFSHTV